MDGTTWDEYKTQNSADTKLDVDSDMYSLVANATGINESNITIIAYESPIFYDKETTPVSWQTVLSVVMLILILGLLVFVVLAQYAYQTDSTAGRGGICGEYAAVHS